jgi:two-component system response regulator YesN
MNTVYIVDDDQLILDHFVLKRGIFAGNGFEICGIETDSVRALTEIRQLRPNVVLSDLKMPGLSGAQLWNALREERYKPLFVLISAYGDFAEARSFFALAGGFDYLLKPVSDVELSSLLWRLSITIDGEPVASTTETASRPLNEILRFLKSSPAMDHTLKSIGERFSINPNSVCNLFAKHLGTTFITYLSKLRLEQAKDLLRVTDLTIREIGVRCGYKNYYYFTRVFDEAYGRTPTEYRRELHAQGQ